MSHQWKTLLRQNFTDWKKLADFLQLNSFQQERILKKSSFVLNLPLRLAQKIKKGTLDDPILRQFLPTLEERTLSPGFITDPVGDSKCRIQPKLLHKYRGRVLLVTTSACAMHCRYCFRQNFDYEVQEKSFDEELDAITKDDTISEVILSGGDPLSLNDTTLEALLRKIASISHIKRVRFHTRFPIGIPERITEKFLHLLREIPLQVWFVIHVNHPNELDDTIILKLKAIHQTGAMVLNQAVLLKGVNDNLETLKKLFLQLVDHGIYPYYLHQLDKVQGAAHFEVPKSKGILLIKQLREALPGYALPEYVEEISGEAHKSPIV